MVFLGVFSMLIFHTSEASDPRFSIRYRLARIVGQSKPDQKSCWMNPPAMQCLAERKNGETTMEWEVKIGCFLCAISMRGVSRLWNATTFWHSLSIHYDKLWVATVRSCWIHIVYINVLYQNISKLYCHYHHYCIYYYFIYYYLLLSLLSCLTIFIGDLVLGNHPSNNSYRNPFKIQTE